jgi:ribosomal protein S10
MGLMNSSQMNITNQWGRLHEQAKVVANQYKANEQQLVSIIALIDQQKAFYNWGYSSLFKYITDGLGLSDATACNISAVVRKSIEVPRLKEKVVSGEISLSKARKITPVINSMNQDQWFETAQTKTQKQIERAVSLQDPNEAILESLTYVSDNQYNVERIQV